MAKAQELHPGDKNGHFNLMSEWVVVHDQPHYVSRYEEILALEGVDLIDPTKVMLVTSTL